MSVSVFIAFELALSPSLEEFWLSQLPLERQARIRSWPDAAMRHRSLVATRLLQLGLSQAGFPLRLKDLRYAADGKPAFDGAVRFSLSHCENRVACAVAPGVDVGIDVEAVGAVSAMEFPSYFNADERAWAGASARRFCVLWTRKEAVAKAAGSQGLRAMRHIDLSVGQGVARHAGKRWSTVAVPAGRGHVAHVAVNGSRPRVSVHRVRRRTLEAGWHRGQSGFLQER